MLFEIKKSKILKISFRLYPFPNKGPLLKLFYDNCIIQFLSTLGLILILTLGLTIYGAAVFKSTTDATENQLQTRKAWDQFKGGFFVGACGSAGFALICLSSIPSVLL